MPHLVRIDPAVPESPAERKVIYEGFLIGIILKLIISINEVITGIALLLIPPALLLSLVHWAEGFVPKTGFIGSHLTSQLESYTAHTALFLSAYLLIRGVIKAFLMVALLRNNLWAYPSSLVVMGLFVLYQLYQIATSGSIPVIVITVFDLIVMYFVWREYRIVRARLRA